MGVAAYGPWEATKWSKPAFIIGGVCWLVGAVVGAGAKWVEEQGRDQFDEVQSTLVSASLRALRAVQTGQLQHFAPARQQLLQGIVDTTRRIVPRPRGRLHACLLRMADEQLTVVAYSAYREGRIPSGKFDVGSQPVGAIAAWKERRMAHVPDTTHDEHNQVFSGKSYRSILAFPLMDSDRCIGVVSVDSTLPNHFTGHLENLDVAIRPYVELLGHFEALAADDQPVQRKGASK